jgi:hypothetical protein
VILAHANILAGMKLCAPLAHNDAACSDLLPAKDFHAEPFGFRIPTISRTAAAFFLCHFLSSIIDAAPHGEQQPKLFFDLNNI